MPTIIVVGAQWGDEGKAKVVDLLAARADACIRFQGGPNAGHTVVWSGRRFVFHMVPTGILREDVRCFLGASVVLDPDALYSELDQLRDAGIDPTGRLGVSRRCHLILPYHRLLDGWAESLLGDRAIGTTLRGIGPAYEDKIGRRGILAGDLCHPSLLRRKVAFNLERARRLVGPDAVGHPALSLEALLDRCTTWRRWLEPLLVDVGGELDGIDARGGRLLFEGAQGTLLDIDHGTYPHVTSSNCIAPAAWISAGLDRRREAIALGVTKAYTTRVGAGPFPTELHAGEGAELRRRGGEYGATTGRPRRCGWLDLVALRHAARVNGLEALALSKIDILDGLPEIKVCTRYAIEGQPVDQFPLDGETLRRVQPIYETLPGWSSPTAGLESIEELPAAARDFLSFVQDGIGVPLGLVCTGPDRSDYLIPPDSPLHAWIQE